MKYQTRTLTEYAITCARCGARGPWERSRENARDAAEADGWVLKDGEAICPECYETPAERMARALNVLEHDPLLREAYRYALSFPGDSRTVRGPAEVDGLPRYALYFWHLARNDEADRRYPDGTVAFQVGEPERTLFPDLCPITAIAVWEENGRVEYRTGGSIEEAVYGNLPK